MSAPEEHSIPAAGNPPDGPFSPTDGRVVGIAVAVFAVVGGAFLLIAALDVRHWFPIAILFYAWAISSLGLLAIWVGLGNDRFYVRFPIALVPCALISLLTGFVTTFTFLTLTLLAGALPFFILRGFGFKLRVESPNSAADLPQPKPIQFSLRQMLICSGVLSVVALLMRLSFMFTSADSSWREIMSMGIFVTMFSSLSTATTCIVLMPRTKRMVFLWLLAVSCFAIFLAWIIPLLLYGAEMHRAYSYRSQEFFMIGAATLCFVWLIAIALLAFRRVGYRLTRRGHAVADLDTSIPGNNRDRVLNSRPN